MVLCVLMIIYKFLYLELNKFHLLLQMVPIFWILRLLFFCKYFAIFSQRCDASIICVLGSTSTFKVFVPHVCKKWVRTPCCAPNCRVIVEESQLLHYYALLCHCLNLAFSLTSSSYDWSCINLWIYLQVCTNTYLWICMRTRTRMWSVIVSIFGPTCECAPTHACGSKCVLVLEQEAIVVPTCKHVCELYSSLQSDTMNPTLCYITILVLEWLV